MALLLARDLLRLVWKTILSPVGLLSDTFHYKKSIIVNITIHLIK